jgi:hypothetical protein
MPRPRLGRQKRGISERSGYLIEKVRTGQLLALFPEPAVVGSGVKAAFHGLSFFLAEEPPAEGAQFGIGG